jgi:TonB family protein
MVPAATGWLAELDVWLIGGWAVCSLLALGALFRSALALRSQRRSWASGSVGGVPVSISRVTGPAAAGILRPEIVVPAWVLASEVLAFAAPTVLEQRLRVLTGERPRLSDRARGGAFALVLIAPFLLIAIPAPPPPSAELVRSALAVWLEDGGGQPVHAMESSGRVELMNRHEAPAIVRRLYPATLREAGIGGTVIVDAFVDEAGRVREMRINEGSGQQDLDRAGLDVMRDLRFAPARAAGSPVSTWVQYPVTFLPDDVQGGSGPPVRVAIWSSGG